MSRISSGPSSACRDPVIRVSKLPCLSVISANLFDLSFLQIISFVCLSFCLFVFLSVCLFVFLSFCLFVFLSFCLFVFLSVCLFVCLSFCLFVLLSVCLFDLSFLQIISFGRIFLITSLPSVLRWL